MWKKLAAKELIEGLKALKAAKQAPANAPMTKDGRYAIAGWNKAMFLGEAQACFDRARSFRSRANKAAQDAWTQL